jgi:heptosyltransferase-2
MNGMDIRHFKRLTTPGVVTRLLVRVPNWLGDAVLCTPALMALRAGFPQARLTILAKPRVAELLQQHPAVDDIIVYRSPGAHGGLGGKWALARSLRRRRFDLAVLFQNAFEAALISLMAGIPNRYGYPTDGRWLLLSHRVPQPPNLREKHQVEYYLELLRPLGLSVEPTPPILAVMPDEQRTADELIRSLGVSADQPIVGLNPGSTYGTAKRWLPDRYAEVANRLAAEYGAHVLIFGTRDEETLGAAIAGMMKAPNTVLSGRTTVRQLMALTKRCQLFVTNDAGPMHIASALGVQVVAVFGPTDPRTTSPFGKHHELVRRPVECAPCLLRECPIDHRCMRGILSDMVHAAAVRQLGAIGLHPKPDKSPGGDHERSQPAGVVFLDRDGTLNPDPGYLNDPASLHLLPGVGVAVARLNKAGFKTVLITNQSGVGRGLIRREVLGAVHARLRELLAESGAWLDGVYACVHRPDEGCACRKPGIGLVLQAREELGLSTERTFVIGDRAIDIALARNIGAVGIFVSSGYQPEREQAHMSARGISPDFTALNLGEAVDWVIKFSLSPVFDHSR